jgi:formylglycine-generating enzyme required for sulfatase activity/anti-sigma factor RsiW
MPDAIKHPSLQDLIAFGQGKLAQADADAVARHLAACSPCRAAAEKAADAFLGKVGEARSGSSGTCLPPGPKGPDGPSSTGSGSHPSAKALALFSQGKLSEAQSATVAAHLAGCAACRQAVAAPSDSALLLSRSGAAGVPAQAPSAPAPANLPPELAHHPKFRIVRELGRGGMGVVYEAEQTLMERKVAIKVINPTVLEHPEALARFHAEVRAAGKLGHDNIVRAYDAEQAGNLHLLVMEFVEGITLAQLVEQKGPLPVAQACRFLHHAALGLQHAFEKGMAHRDVKPHNLMLSREGRVKVLDFGLARLREQRAGAQVLTQMDSFMGTPDYVAPEQATDARTADTRSDVYSLGCTLYFLLTGRPPFVEDTPVKVVLAHIEKEPPPLHEVRADVPEGLTAVAARMLAKEPGQRFQQPVEVARALLPFAKGDKSSARGDVALPPGTKSAGTGTAVRADTSMSKGLRGATSQPPARTAAQEAGAPFSDLGAAKKTRKGHAAKAPASLPWWQRRGVLAGAIGAAVVLLVAAGILLKVKTAGGEAFVVLEIDQPGAEVQVDGQKITVNVPGDGQPIEVKVEPGQHRLRISKGGFEVFTEDIELKVGKSAPIKVALKPIPRPEGIAVLEIDQPGAEVRVDEQPKIAVKALGDGKQVEVKGEPGLCKVRISKDGFEDFTQEMELKVGKPAVIKVALKPLEAIVALEIDPPDAEVQVDGKKVAANPDGEPKAIEIKRKAGRWQLRVSKDGFEDYSQEIESKPGKSAPIKVALKPRARVRPEALDCTRPEGVGAAEVRRAQEAWAKYLGCPVEETVEVAEGVKMTFVLVPPGKFRMGSPENEKDREKDETLREVTLTAPFYLGKTEVTQAQYQALGLKNPSHFKGDDLPVEMVTWTEARDWAAKLTAKLADQQPYRLPTEAEWEYACRGGRPSVQPFGVGDGRTLSSREANFNGNHPYGGTAKGPYLESTCAVGSYPANALGLHDMHGNVWEWCADGYGPYPPGAATNPTGPSGEGSARVIRGGDWLRVAADCRAAYRRGPEPSHRFVNLGFRLARSVPSGVK